MASWDHGMDTMSDLPSAAPRSQFVVVVLRADMGGAASLQQCEWTGTGGTRRWHNSGKKERRKAVVEPMPEPW